MIEYQLVLTGEPSQNDQNRKYVIKGSDRGTMISKYNYINNLLNESKKRNISAAKELYQWTSENIDAAFRLKGIQGLYGVSSIQIL